MGSKKNKITALRKEFKETGNLLLKHQADVLASGGRGAQSAKLSEKIQKKKLTEDQGYRIGIRTGLIKPPTYQKTQPSLAFDQLIAGIKSGDISSDQLSQLGFTDAAGKPLDFESPEFQAFLTGELNKSPYAGYVPATTTTFASTPGYKGPAVSDEDIRNYLISQAPILTPGEKVYFDPREQKLTNEPANNLSLYFDEKTYNLTFDPTNQPYVFGVTPHVPQGTPDAAIKLTGKAPLSNIITSLVQPQLAVLAESLSAQGMSEMEVANQIFPMGQLARKAVYRANSAYQIDVASGQLLGGPKPIEFEQMLRAYEADNRIIVDQQKTMETGRLTLLYSAEQLESIGFILDRHPITGEIISVKAPPRKGPVKQAWEWAADKVSWMLQAFGVGTRPLKVVDPNEFTGYPQGQWPAFSTRLDSLSVEPQRVNTNTIYITVNEDGTQQPVTLNNGIDIFKALNWSADVIQKGLEQPGPIVVNMAKGVEGLLPQMFMNTGYSAAMSGGVDMYGHPAGGFSAAMGDTALLESEMAYADLLQQSNSEAWTHTLASWQQKQEVYDAYKKLHDNPLDKARELLYNAKIGIQGFIDWGSLDVRPAESKFASEEAQRAEIARLTGIIARLENVYRQESINIRQNSYGAVKDLYEQGIPMSDARWQTVKDQVRKAITLGRQATPGDPYFFWTWAARPDREELFLNAVAEAELQLLRPLTYPEIYDISMPFTDSATQLAFEIPLDLMNVMSVPAIGEVLAAPLNLLGKGMVQGARELVDMSGVTRWLSQQAVISIARKTGNSIANVLEIARPGLKDTDAAIQWIRSVTNIVSGRNPTQMEETVRALLAFDPRLQQKEATVLWDLGQHMNDVTKLPSLAERAYDTLIQDLYNIYESAEIKAGHEITPELAALLVEKAKNEALNGRSFGARFADLITRQLRAQEAVTWSKYFYSDSWIAKADEGITAAIRKLEEITTAKAAEPAYLVEVGRKQPLTLQLEKDFTANLSEALRSIQKVGRRAAEQFLGNWSAHIRQTWFNAVLSARPAWSFFNAVDSNIRGAIKGMGLFDDLEVIRQAMARGDASIPYEVLGASFGDLQGPMNAVQDFIYTGKRPSFGGLGQFWGYFTKNWKEQGPVTALRNAYRSWYTGWMDYNLVMEASVRLRTYYANVNKALKILQPAAIEKIIGTLPEAIRPTMTELLKVSQGNPYSLGVMLDLILDRATEGRVAFSHVVPDFVLNSPFARDAAGQMVIQGVVEQLYDFIGRLEKAGIEKTNWQSEIRKFWDTAYEDWARAAANKMQAGPIETLLNQNEFPDVIAGGRNVGIMPENAMDDVIALDADLASRQEIKVFEQNFGIPHPGKDVEPAQVEQMLLSTYSPEDQAIIDKYNEAMSGARQRVNELLDVATEDPDNLRMANNLAHQLDQVSDLRRRMNLFGWDFFPGPRYPLNLLNESKSVLWQRARALAVYRDSKMPDFIDTIVRAVNAGAGEELTPKLITQNFLDTMGIKLEYNTQGRISRIIQDAPIIPGLNNQRRYIMSDRTILNMFETRFKEILGGADAPLEMWRMQQEVADVVKVNRFGKVTDLSVDRALQQAREWLAVYNAEAAPDLLRDEALARAEEVAQGLRDAGVIVPNDLRPSEVLQGLEAMLQREGLELEGSPVNIISELAGNVSDEVAKSAETIQDLAAANPNSTADIAANIILDGDPIKGRAAQEYLGTKGVDDYHAFMRKYFPGNSEDFAIIKSNFGDLYMTGRGVQKEFYSNPILAEKGMGVKVIELREKRLFLGNISKGRQQHALEEIRIFQGLGDDDIFPHIYRAYLDPDNNRAIALMELVDVVKDKESIVSELGLESDLARAVRNENLRHFMEAHDPKAKRFFENFFEAFFGGNSHWDGHNGNFGFRRSDGKLLIIDLPFHVRVSGDFEGKVGYFFDLMGKEGPDLEALRAVNNVYRPDADELWMAYAQVQGLSKNWGPAANNFPDFMMLLNNRMEDLVRAGVTSDDFIYRQYANIVEEAQEAHDYIGRFLNPTRGISPPPLPRYMMPEAIQTALALRDINVGEAGEWLDTIKRWGNWWDEGAKNGSLFIDLPTEQLDAIREARNPAINVLAELQDTVNYGGEATFLPGKNFEGAVNITNFTHIDYSQFSRFDNTMRSMYPFWMFQSRNVVFWLNALANHPELATLYNKYMLYSERRAFEMGAITSRGEALPSLEGYIPIPGLGIWVNPLAPLSMRYIFPRKVDRYDSEEDGSFGEQLLRGFVTTSQERGFSLPFWITHPLYQMGVLDPNKIPRYAIIPQMSLLPPNWQRSLRHYMRKYFNPFGSADLLFPEMGWEDYMTEREILTDTYSRMLLAKTDAERMELALQAQLAIRDREKTDLWNTTQGKMDTEEWFRDWAGYFTGIFGKPFSDSDADFIALRLQINTLRDMVNSEIGAQMFGLDPISENRYEAYIDSRYKTPEGVLNNLYNTVRYVQSPTGIPLYGQDRRDMVGQLILEEQQTRSYFTAVEMARQNLDSVLQTLPIGAPYELKAPFLDKYFEALAKASHDYPYTQGVWVPGLKTPSLIQDHFDDVWFGFIESSAPDRADYDTKAEYDEAYKQFLIDIPNMLPSLISHVPQMLSDIMKVDLNKMPEDLLGQLYQNTTASGYKAWKRSNDGAFEAIDNAWQALVLDPYFTALDGKTGNARQVAEQEFLANFTPVTFDALYSKVVEIYGSQFTTKELMDAFYGREQLNPEQYLDNRRALQVGEEQFNIEQDIWKGLLYVSPGKEFNKFLKEMEAVGGHGDDVFDWYQFDASAWKPEDMKAFRDHIYEAIKNLELQAPTQDELKDRAQAEGLNTTYKQALEAFFPGINEDRDHYFNAQNQREWKAANPEKWERIQAANDFADFFGYSYPLWARFYNPGILDEGYTLKGTKSSSFSNTRDIYAAPKNLFSLPESVKRKLELYYSYGSSLPENLRNQLRTIWVKEGKPEGDLNTWIRGGLKRMFRITGVPRSKNKGGRGGGDSSGSSYYSGSLASGGGGSDRGSVRLGVRSTLDPRYLLLSSNIGTARPTLPPVWPQGMTVAVGYDAVAAIVEAYQQGRPIDAATIQFLRGLASRHPEWEGIIEETINTANLT
jgi:hypothetical protein